MGPKKNAPKKIAGSSSSQQSKGKEVVTDSSIPAFGSAVERDLEVADDAFFEAEKIVSKITDQGKVNKIFLSHNIELGRGALIARPPLEGEWSCAPLDEEYAAWSDEHFKAGAFLPLDQYFADFLTI